MPSEVHIMDKAFENKISRLVEDGLATKRIANALNLPFYDVKELIIDNNLSLKKEIFTDAKIVHICELYEAGVSAKTLGKKYSIDKRRVQRWVELEGILRNKNDSHRVTYFNQNYFDEIDTPAKAYWLGFFYADTYNCDLVNTVSFGLQGSDEAHLRKLAIAVGLPTEKVSRNITNAGDDVCNLRLYSKHMCGILAGRGCPRAKSFIIRYPEWLDNCLDVHFIRGMFDGDGCLTYREKQREWKWSLVSTKECCESISNILERNGIKVNYYYISKTDNNTYEMATSGNEKITKIVDYLYNESDDDTRLSRKYELYLRLKEQQERRNERIGRKNYLLSIEQKEAIKEAFSQGDSARMIADSNGIHVATVNRLLGKWKR